MQYKGRDLLPYAAYVSQSKNCKIQTIGAHFNIPLQDISLSSFHPKPCVACLNTNKTH